MKYISLFFMTLSFLFVTIGKFMEYDNHSLYLSNIVTMLFFGFIYIGELLTELTKTSKNIR